MTTFRCAGFGVRAGVIALTLICCLDIAACGKTPAPEDAAKNVPAPALIAAPSAKSQKAEPPRVDPAAARDTALAAAVKAALAGDARLKSFAIDIRAANGAVELFGTVDAASNRVKAGRIAAAVDGVKSVKNNLVLVSGS